MSPVRSLLLGLVVALALPGPARAQESEPTPFWLPTEPETKPKKEDHKKAKKKPPADDEEAPEARPKPKRKPPPPARPARTPKREAPPQAEREPEPVAPPRPKSKYEPLPPIPHIEPDEPPREAPRPVAPRPERAPVRPSRALPPVDVPEPAAPAQPPRNEYAPRPLDYTPRDAPRPAPAGPAAPAPMPVAPAPSVQPASPAAAPALPPPAPAPQALVPIDERPVHTGEGSEAGEREPSSAGAPRHRIFSVALVGGLWAKPRADSTGRDWRLAYGLDLGVSPYRPLLIDLRVLRASTTSGNAFASTSDTHLLAGMRVHYVFTKGILSLLAGAGAGMDYTQTSYALEPPGGTPQTLGASAIKLTAEGALGVRVRPFSGLEARLEVTGVLRDGNLEPLLSLGVGWAF